MLQLGIEILRSHPKPGLRDPRPPHFDGSSAIQLSRNLEHGEPARFETNQARFEAQRLVSGVVAS